MIICPGALGGEVWAGATQTQSQEEHAEADERGWVNGTDGGTYPVMRKGVRDINGLSEAKCISLTFSEV